MQNLITWRPWRPITVLVAISLAWCAISPDSAAAQPDPVSSIKQTLEARYPDVHVLDVKASPISGVYEVYLGDQIVYTDARADYLLGGPLIDAHTRKNLTEAHLNDYGKVDFSALPFDRAIKIVKGDGSRKFAVFSDPDCPFCQQLEKSLLPVKNVTMYVFLYPIASLHPQAPAKAHSIWCAKDRAQAWTSWMQEKKLPPAATCSGDPVDELQQLAAHLRINGTPTLFLSDGHRVTGAMSTAEIERALGTAGGTNIPAATPAPK